MKIYFNQYKVSQTYSNHCSILLIHFVCTFQANNQLICQKLFFLFKFLGVNRGRMVSLVLSTVNIDRWRISHTGNEHTNATLLIQRTWCWLKMKRAKEATATTSKNKHAIVELCTRGNQRICFMFTILLLQFLCRLCWHRNSFKLFFFISDRFTDKYFHGQITVDTMTHTHPH